MTLDEIKAGLRRMDPDFNEVDETYQAQLVLMASLEVGTNVRRLSNFTELPFSLVSKFSRRLRKSGVWRNRKVYADWLDEEDGGTAFLLDTMVATGLLQRTP